MQGGPFHVPSDAPVRLWRRVSMAPAMLSVGAALVGACSWTAP